LRESCAASQRTVVQPVHDVGVGVGAGRTTMANGDARRLAVLIDADNASAAVASELLEAAAKYGKCFRG